jgi:GNAT superfamily N-acetyltransferase
MTDIGMMETKTTGAVIRAAGVEDAALLSRLSAETFSAAFAHLYPPADLAAFLAETYDLEDTRRRLADPRSAAWLLEIDGEAVGHALAGPCELPHPDVTPACGELKRIYVLPRWQSGGHGSRLLRTAMDWLEAEKTGSLWIGVWSQNHGAQRLYQRLGFEKAGEYHFKVGSQRDHEFILRRG